MPKGPLDVIEANDHDLFEQISRARDLALIEGALPLKHKLLIALALDASHGAVNGVKSLAQQAMRQGATKEEIMETLRVVNHVCGVGSIYTAAAALQDIL